MIAGQRWDILCRVVDNLGDAAVLWRLARQLAHEYDIRPCLYIDAPEVLARLVPGARAGQLIDGVQIVAIPPVAPLEAGIGGENATLPGHRDHRDNRDHGDHGDNRGHGDHDDDGDNRDDGNRPRLAEDADVVVSGFLARLPDAARKRLRARPGITFVQVEHLSAESWIDGFHGLPSPGPDGLVEHYFYPGFTSASGGLLRERDLIARRDAFRSDPDRIKAWLAARGIPVSDGARIASLFAYPAPPLDALARALACAPQTQPLILVAPGRTDASARAEAAQLLALSRGRLILVGIDFLPQRDYDALLWASDLNIVRGEDSWIRALWAARPMLWRAYPQTEGTDRVKLDAFLDRFGTVGSDSGAGTAPTLPGLLALQAANRWWNCPDDYASPVLDLLHHLPDATRTVEHLTANLLNQRPTDTTARGNDLAARLVAFVGARQLETR